MCTFWLPLSLLLSTLIYYFFCAWVEDETILIKINKKIQSNPGYGIQTRLFGYEVLL
jgi:hypothetical protein